MKNLSNSIYLALMFLFISTNTSAIVPQAERDALVALYDSTGGDNWIDNTNWLVGDPCDNGWSRVTCNSTPSITEVNLSGNRINGTIPPEIGDLVNLKKLFLSQYLTGAIPPEMGNLVNLQILSLPRNNLSGTLPIELGNLQNLKSLSIYDNQLTGNIPLEFGNLTNLENFWLERNQFTGDIPTNILGLKQLRAWGNQFENIPSSIGNMINLERADLYINNIASIPPEIGNLLNLEILRLDRNNITGVIPAELGSLINLNELSLFSNQLTGNIPTELGNLVNLSGLILSNNQLSGTIPQELGNLVSLTGLFLRGNQLSGTIPTELGNIVNLTSLFLDRNQLSGSIPPALNNLTNTSSANLRLNFNALFSNDSTTNTFLDTACNCDWQATQTTAPQNLQIVAASNNSISLNWDQVSYQQHGGYKVMMANDALGPFNEINETISKTITAHTQGGLIAGQDYYFKLKTFTNLHPLNQNRVISDAGDSVLDTTNLTAGSADIWSTITSNNLQQASIGGFIEYIITVGNNGPDNAIGTGFRHNLPTGLSNGLWSCTNISGAAICPVVNGSDNIDLLLDLPTNSSLEFTLTAQVDNINGASLLITSTITPPDDINDSDLLTNIQFLNFEKIFANSFE